MLIVVDSMWSVQTRVLGDRIVCHVTLGHGLGTVTWMAASMSPTAAFTVVTNWDKLGPIWADWASCGANLGMSGQSLPETRISPADSHQGKWSYRASGKSRVWVAESQKYQVSFTTMNPQNWWGLFVATPHCYIPHCLVGETMRIDKKGTIRVIFILLFSVAAIKSIPISK